MRILKLILGFILIFTYHIPRILFSLLRLSYAHVFNSHNNLTADPSEHLNRANRLLKKKENSVLLYSALEIRFAAERMINNQISLADKVSKKTLKKYDPVKKKKAMTSIDPRSAKEQEIFYINEDTGQKIYWGTYKPIELERITEIKNKLGDYLHPKTGINLGISNDPWYSETRKFLEHSEEYLRNILKNNHSFFLYSDVNNFELNEKID